MIVYRTYWMCTEVACLCEHRNPEAVVAFSSYDLVAVQPWNVVLFGNTSEKVSFCQSSLQNENLGPCINFYKHGMICNSAGLWLVLLVEKQMLVHIERFPSNAAGTIWRVICRPCDQKMVGITWTDGSWTCCFLAGLFGERNWPRHSCAGAVAGVCRSIYATMLASLLEEVVTCVVL